MLAIATPTPIRSSDPSSSARQEFLDDPPAAVSRSEQARSPAAVVVRGNHRSIQVNVDDQNNNIVGDAANEPSLAIDPIDRQRIVIGWRQFDAVASNFRQGGYGYSTDGGESWTFPGVLEPGQFRSDPVLAADGDGVFYYYSLQSEIAADMFVSSDGGVSWLGPISAFGGDKTWMTIDTTGGMADGHIYTIWNSTYTCCAPGTDFARSVDSGSTYDGPFAMSSKIYWGTLDVGNDGEVYVVGVLGSSHAVVKSIDIGNPLLVPTFQTHSMTLGGSTVFSAPVNPAGLAGQVWLAVDRSDGATRGNVYVLGSVSRSPDPLDVMFTRSTNGGATWSAPVRVNSDPPGNGASQWFGTMSVAPNGRIDAAWNDTRGDPAGILSEVYYAYSMDAGTTWSGGIPVTPPWDPTVGWPNQNKIGDYYDMISDETGAALAYAATFNGEQDVYFLRLGDCNANGQHDSLDVALGTSEDCDQNLVPDECQENFSCHGPDTDGDGVPDNLDCAPEDPSAFHVPAEVTGVRFLDNKTTLNWSSQAATAGTGTTYAVASGDPAMLPVVSDPTVTCEAFGLADPTFTDVDEPGVGDGLYYLIRGGNACATAGWGLESSFYPRLTFVCDP
jgi:hypothetical protein